MNQAILSTLIFAGLALSGCQAHVNLDAPTAAESSKERLAAWEALRATDMQETHVTYLRGGVPVGAERRTDYLQLADGQRVYHPTDLAPVVAPESPTGRAIGDYEATTDLTLGLSLGGVTVLLAGGATMVGTIATSDLDDGLPTGFWVGTAIAGAGAAVLLAVPFLAQRANDEKATAFTTYNRALMDRLGLCPADDGVAPCEIDDPAATERSAARQP